MIELRLRKLLHKLQRSFTFCAKFKKQKKTKKKKKKHLTLVRTGNRTQAACVTIEHCGVIIEGFYRKVV